MLPWARRNYRVAAAHNLSTPRFVGRIHTGILSATALSGLVRSVRPGITELMVHPGYADEALARTGTRLLASRGDEVRLLCGSDIRRVLDRAGIELVRHDLTSSLKRSLPHAS
jgi:predicted glycoside hydrolase/deacetylase ChbG (UPF0249 family)